MTQSTEGPAIYCFVDTDIFLHFRMFDEIDWKPIFDEQNVCIVLSPAVMYELNQHKDSNSEGRQKRARTVVQKLRALLPPRPGQVIPIRPGVCLLDIVKEPQVNWSDLGLDPSSRDDRQIATIIEFMQVTPKEQIFFLSNDFLAQRKALTHDIQVIDPESKIPPVERASPEQARIQQLERENQALKSRFADVKLFIWDQNTIATSIKRPLLITDKTGPTDQFISETIETKRQHMLEIVEMAKRRYPEDAKEYLEDYTKYLLALEVAMKAHRVRTFGARYEMVFLLQNTSPTPATDVKVNIIFPPGSFIEEQDEEDFIIGAFLNPHEPEPGWELSLSARLLPTLGPHDLMSPNSQREGPIFGDDRCSIAYKDPKLRQGEDWQMWPIIVYISPQIKQAFQIKYSIRADNVKPEDGFFNVVLQ